MKNKIVTFGLAFLFILFSIAFGHIVMSLVEKYFKIYSELASFIFFLIGFSFVYFTKIGKTDKIWQNIGGVMGGLFVWTGLEYSFIFASERFGIQQSQNGTRAEYLIMEWSWGIFLLITLYLLFQESIRCPFFLWIRKKMHLMKVRLADGKIYNYGPRVLMEYSMITWSGYLICLLAFDEKIFGVHHPVTYILFIFTGLTWTYTAWMAWKQPQFGSMIRWLIPTVIIFWTAFLEIIPKWGGFVQPWETGNWYAMLSLVLAFIFTFILFLSKPRLIKEDKFN